jgi:hypothetical protein
VIRELHPLGGDGRNSLLRVCAEDSNAKNPIPLDQFRVLQPEYFDTRV